jgi:hypothetical protein
MCVGVSSRLASEYKVGEPVEHASIRRHGFGAGVLRIASRSRIDFGSPEFFK